ncbi:glycoside hydrolase family 72 protein [Patellaria atrata CBS 101060]|uniref:1,3-beta-glucanosyltransferase n=1 Tax=Patellaria atrata CBS 101060 TaxID=1346257 RepID=A0A9P4VR27_9PEZI|nr:glycoside hydrolase family 72 protein [Patellaria atrata CBS 101060]
MKGVGAFIAASAALCANTVLATPTKVEKRASGTRGNLPTVTVKGNAFFAGDDRFYIRGVDYQPGGAANAADPLADRDVCERDVEKFKELGINTVRIYTIDNSKDHDYCMGLLDEAGIYLALDVNTPDYSINRADPHPSYNDVYLQSVFATIDAFSKYNNLLLFFSANEVVDSDNTTHCAPYVKAVTRDMKAYIKARGYRNIPVGYSAADVDANRYEMAQYMNCGSDDVRSDFFAFNDYSWCDPSTFQQSGWDQKVRTYSNYSIPLFLSEYGCITNTRQWKEIKTLYSDSMTGVYSGGLVYEYTEEEAGYGLVEVQSDTKVRELEDFSTLKAAFKATPEPRGDGGYRENGRASQCPPQSDTWDVSGSELPEIPTPAKAFFQKGAGRGPGLSGDSSQYAGTPSDSEISSGTSGGESESATSTGAAASLHIPEMSFAPLVCGFVVLFSSLFGASLL